MKSLYLFAALVLGAQVGGDTVPGTSARCQGYLPRAERLINIGGSDGSGLCVFTSMEHSGRQSQIEILRGFQKWMSKRPGGGYPSKVDAMLKQYCAEKGVPVPRYIQVTKTDLEFLKQALKTGRLVCITYGQSPTGRYGGRKIAHMVNLAHADDRWWAVLDNNYIDQLEWMNEAEFKHAHEASSRGPEPGWSIVFYQAPPPLGPFHN